jgi:aldose 1-epimerase
LQSPPGQHRKRGISKILPIFPKQIRQLPEGCFATLCEPQADNECDKRPSKKSNPKMVRSSKSILPVIILLALAGVLGQCKGESKSGNKKTDMAADKPTPSIEKIFFGPYPEGGQVMLYRLRNSAGMEVDILNYGGIITRWTAPDQHGIFKDVVLGFDRLAPYLNEHPYFGALIGRYGNRIGGGKFPLDGKVYTLVRNNAGNHLHGGEKGFDKVLWEANPLSEDGQATLLLTYNSPDGEEGYPGNLKVEVTYTLTEANELDIHYRAITDKPTIVNLTQHTYFNLSGNFQQTVLDHELELRADSFLPVDSGLIPLGEFRPVTGTPLDFRTPKPIGADIDADYRQIAMGGGFDHCWVLNGAPGEYHHFATVRHPESGRILKVYTDQPGVQFYSGNFLNNSLPAKGGGMYGPRSGFCLETQHFPDAPNQAGFPSVRLDPGQTYEHRTTYAFHH